ncbi:unnamed protein product [Colias eurytheme]|nr:unnamed protein product [Colias eurytheme]
MFFLESSDTDSDFDEDIQFLTIATLFKKKKKKRRYWVHPINAYFIGSKGALNTLVQDLETDDERFHRYFRLTKIQFEQVHSLIERDIKKQHTQFRCPIGTKERLAVCLRFLATGNTFRSLAFNYRML